LADVKIGVGGNADGAKAVINVMTDAVNKLGKAVADANKTPFKAVGVEQASKDLAKLQKQFQDTIKMSAALRNALKNSGQNAQAGILNIDWSKLNIDPAAAQRLRNRAFSYAARGTAWDQTNVPQPPVPAGSGGGSGSGGNGGGRRSSSDADDNPRRRGSGAASQFARAAFRGVGGPVGQVGTGALDGAEAGAAEGGAAGGAAGLLKGGLAAVGVVAAMKLGQMGAEGYSMAKDRDLSLDTLKRQLGDLGISFEELRRMSDAASDGLGVNAAEFVKLEQQQSTASSGLDRNELSLADSTRRSVGFARAFGMDPSQTAGMLGGMERQTPISLESQGSGRQLVAMLAEAIEHAKGAALPAEVMQALQQITATTSRLSLSLPNIGAAGSAYASMLQDKAPGMTPSVALGLISQANSAVSGMGAAGEAGQNFTYQALQGTGSRLNPIEAMALSAGGLFGTRNTVFGDGSELGKYMHENGMDDELLRLRRGGDGDTTNFRAIKTKLNHDFTDPLWRVNAAQRYFGVQSPQQAAALLRMDDKDYGGLNDALGAANVSLKDVNASGLRTLASIGRAKTPDELNKVYADIRGRTGDGALSKGERQSLDALQASGKTDDFKNALVRIMAGKDQQETLGSDMRKSAATLENIQIALGDKLVPAVNAIRDALLFSVGKSSGMPMPASLEDAVRKSVASGDAASSQGVLDAFTGDNPNNAFDMAKSWVYKHGAEGEHMATVSALEQKYSLPSGLLKGVWGAESSFGINADKTSSAGAQGNFQAMPDTQNKYGIHIGDFNSEADGAARQLRDLLAKHGGDVHGALFDYNGVVKNVAAGEAYYSTVRKLGGMGADKLPKPDDMSGFGEIDQLPPEHTKGASTGTGKGSRSSAGKSSGVTDTVVLDMNLNVVQDSGFGKKVTKTLSTSVAVPRGSGTQQLGVTVN
jgi:hypothetical protein